MKLTAEKAAELVIIVLELPVALILIYTILLSLSRIIIDELRLISETRLIISGLLFHILFSSLYDLKSSVLGEKMLKNGRVEYR